MKKSALVSLTSIFTSDGTAELVLIYPQKQKVSIDGTEIGTFEHLPATLTLQYHAAPEKKISPYVGAGINYMQISSVKLPRLWRSEAKHRSGIAERGQN